MIKERDDTSTNTSALSQDERNEIIKLYATKISKLCEYHKKITAEIEQMHDDHAISDGETRQLKNWEMNEYLKTVSQLLIEQYFNTSDEELFDRAMELNEDIHLDRISYLDTKALEENRGDVPAITLFYKGFFFHLDGKDASGEKSQPDVKAIIRDPDSVKMVNNKLARAKMILEIEEVTLGKKYYQGICRRSHYRNYQ